MSSLHKDPRGKSPYWYCAYTGPDGRRMFKSTKQTDRRKAQGVCQGFEEAAAKGRQGTLTEAQARKILSEVIEKTSGEPIQFHSCKEWMTEWVNQKRVIAKKGTLAKYEQVVNSFLEHLDTRQNLAIAAITPKDIRTYRDNLLKEGRRASTVNLLVSKVLNIPFHQAFRMGYIPTNPVVAIQSLKSTKPDKDVFTQEQLLALLKAAKDEGEWRNAIILAYYTGARLQDVANMRWGSIDLDQKLIDFVPFKTDKKVIIPIHPELEACLIKMTSSDDPQAFLFPSLTEQVTGGRNGLSGTFAKIMEKAKIKLKTAPKAGKKGRSINSLSFHSLRHSFNSAMANQGIAEEIRRKLTGHESSEVHRSYTHHEIATLRQAVQVIPSLGISI